MIFYIIITFIFYVNKSASQGPNWSVVVPPLKVCESFKIFYISPYIYMTSSDFPQSPKSPKTPIKQMRKNILRGHLFIEESDPVLHISE